ncbi:MAG: hypothetical protein HF962_00500 [Sulfurovum sp.]|nr:hypothetical protein [Sulfurovum sp.]
MSMKVALVVGHRYGSQGAYGSAGVSEYRYYDELLLPVLLPKLPERKVKVFYRQDRPGYTKNMKQLHKEMDKWGADYRISLHFNASANPKVNGHEVLYNENDTKSKNLAIATDRILDKHLKNRDRNIVGRYRGRGGGFLRRGKGINILIEPFFAAHQHGFMPGTLGFVALVSALEQLVLGLLGVGIVHREKKKVRVSPPRYYLGVRSNKHLLQTPIHYQAIIKRAIEITGQDFSVIERGYLRPYPRDAEVQPILDALTEATLQYRSRK